MDNKPISTLQLAILIFLLIPGNSLVFVPGTAAAQDAWLSSLLAIGSGLFVLYAIIKLHDIYPGQKITTISTSVLGKIPGIIFNLLFLWSILLYTVWLFYSLIMLLEIIYPLQPSIFLLSILMLTCVFFMYTGLNALGRFGELLIWPVLLFLFAGVILVMPIIDLSNLQPVLVNWKPVVAGILYVAEWPFTIVVVMGLFLPMVSGLSNRKSRLKIYWWYLGGGAFLVLYTILTYASLGNELISIYQFPVYEMFRLAGFGDFQRIELLFFFLWFTTGIACIIIFYQVLLFMVQDICGLPDYKSLILPLGLFLLVFTLYMFPNTIEYELLGFKDIPVYTLPINFLYPTVLLIAAKIKQKRLT